MLQINTTNQQNTEAQTQRGASPLLSPHVITAPSPITAQDIRYHMIADGIPSGVRIANPKEVIATMREKGHDPDDCYEPDKVIEVILENPDDLCSLHLTLEQIFATQSADLPEDAPHLKIFGEQHHTESHVMLQACAVAANDGTLYCSELPINMLDKYAQNAYKLTASDLSPAQLEEIDPQGHLFARSFMNDKRYRLPYATNHLLQTILNTGATIRLVDVMRTTRNAIDLNDPLLPATLEKTNTDPEVIPSSDLDPDFEKKRSDKKSMIVRNHIMVQRIHDATLDNKHIVICTGNYHLGAKPEDLDYTTSLPHLLHQVFQDQNPQKPFALTSVLPPNLSNNDTPERIIPRGSDPYHVPVIVRGLSESRQAWDDESDIKSLSTSTLRQSFVDAEQTALPGFRAFDEPQRQDYDTIRQELATALGVDYS